MNVVEITDPHGEVLMGCGHVAVAFHHLEPGQTCSGLTGDHPSCPICISIDSRACKPIERPPLEGRQAICSYGRDWGQGPRGGHKYVPSDWGLAFFEYRGPGSHQAEEICGRCKKTLGAHTNPIHPEDIGHSICVSFTPQGDTPDEYYCGCMGWD